MSGRFNDSGGLFRRGLLGFVGLSTLAWAAVWVAALAVVQVWCQRRLSEIPSPLTGTEGVVLQGAFGLDWSAFSDRRWWGEAIKVQSGWRGGTLRDKDGKEIFMDFPSFAGAELVDGMRMKYQSRFETVFWSSGWPWRTWLVVWERDGRDQQGAVETVLRGVYWRGVALTVFTAWVLGLGTGLVVGTGYRAVVGRVRRGQGLCPGCGYDVRGLRGAVGGAAGGAGAVCPECGRGVD
jgi:hypothetical protein